MFALRFQFYGPKINWNQAWHVRASSVAAAASLELAGCSDGTDGGARDFMPSFPTVVLVSWTLLCGLYSWWMLHGSPWHMEKPQVTGLVPSETLMRPMNLSPCWKEW